MHVPLNKHTFGRVGAQIQVSPVVHGRLPQSVSGRLRGLPPAGDDGLRVNLLGDEQLGFLVKDDGSHDLK